MPRPDADELARGGFWRRALSLIIDWLSVALPCAVLAGLLFAASAGHIQASVGLDMTACVSGTSYAGTLVPEPPKDSNFVTECLTRSIAGPTRHSLVVGHRVKTETSSKEIARTYMLSADGKVVDGLDWSWGVSALLLLNLVLSQWRWGRTLGSRAAGLRLVRQGDPLAARVPLGRVLSRYALMLAGFVPALLVGGLVLYSAVTGPDERPPSLAGVVVALLLMAAWSLWNTILIVRKRDPFYDRWAGTALVRAS